MVGSIDGNVLRPARAGVVVMVLAIIAVLLPAVPADASVTVNRTSTSRVLGNLTVERLDMRVDGRRVRGDLLSFPKDDPALELRPRLARGTAVGLQTMAAFSAAERPRGGLAGINGGYWQSRPTGVPNGLFIERDRMVGADSALRSGIPAGRAVAGMQQDGTMVADRIDVRLELTAAAAGIQDLKIDELNRQVRTASDRTAPVTGELMLFDGRYGTSFEVPPGAVLFVLDDLSLRSSGFQTATVRDRRPSINGSRWTVADGTSVLLAYGTSVPLVQSLQAGMEVRVRTRVAPRNSPVSTWNDLRSSVPGAGLLIRNGRLSTGPAMDSEGINHTYARRARTAIGQKPDGTTLLLTVDERGGSTGVTLHELARIMERLGANNAVAMDGGGSTSMTIDGRIRNQPSDPNRGQASAWFVYAPRPDAPRDLADACPSGGAPTGSFDDTRATVHAAAIDCLSWWGVTSGITLTSYAPAAGVTRGQMASFLARWIDGAVDRGDGQALPATASQPFRDVPATYVHADAIARLAEVDIIRGRSATAYDPGAPVTRGETATLLRRAMEYVQDGSLPAGRDTFVDDNGTVHEPSIDRLAGLGVVSGTSGFAYRPNDPVSRGAMASMLMRASDWLVEEGLTTPPA